MISHYNIYFLFVQEFKINEIQNNHYSKNVFNYFSMNKVMVFDNILLNLKIDN